MLLLLVSCAAEQAASPVLPGPMEHLRLEALEGASWTSANDRLPPEVRVGELYPGDPTFALTEPFGRRPLPPGIPGISSEYVTMAGGEIWLLVTIPSAGGEAVGEQFLLATADDPAGTRLDGAWHRFLCSRGIDHETCSP